MKRLIILTILFGSILFFISSCSAATLQGMSNDVNHKFISNTIHKSPSKTVTGLSTSPTVAGALDNNNLIFKNDSGWYVTSDAWYSDYALSAGGYYSYSGSKEYTVYTTVRGPGTLKFYWETQTDGFASGVFTFYDNNVEKMHIHRVYWVPESYKVYSGTHILKWVFINQEYIDGDSYTSSCDLDMVKWIPADTTIPKVISTIPTNLKTGVSRTSPIAIKFNENIKASTYYNSIKLKNLSTGTYKTVTKAISGNTLYIKSTTKLYANTWYQVILPIKSVKDYAGNNMITTYSLKFKTRTL